MMLPRREEVKERILAAPAIDYGIFNHPVIVISRNRYQGKVAVFVVSLFPSPTPCVVPCLST